MSNLSEMPYPTFAKRLQGVISAAYAGMCQYSYVDEDLRAVLMTSVYGYLKLQLPAAASFTINAEVWDNIDYGSEHLARTILTILESKVVWFNVSVEGEIYTVISRYFRSDKRQGDADDYATCSKYCNELLAGDYVSNSDTVKIAMAYYDDVFDGEGVYYLKASVDLPEPILKFLVDNEDFSANVAVVSGNSIQFRATQGSFSPEELFEDNIVG